MSQHHKIDYLEFGTCDLQKTKVFFSEVFHWAYTVYGEEYVAFHRAGIEGGFFQSDKVSQADKGAALIVFYSENLEQTQRKIVSAGGSIAKEIFTFPGGRRFHFLEPCGNEFAVWSDK